MEDTTPTTQPPDETEDVRMSTEALAPMNLNQALLAARAAVSARVLKAGRNEHQKYNFVSHEHVLQHARASLLAHGLLLEQRSVEYAGELTMAKSVAWRWSGTFALVHHTGEERAYTFAATTQPNDKAAYVASTSLDKVALMRVLQLAGTDDENAEADWHDNQPGGAAYEARQAPRKGPSAPPSNVVPMRAAEARQQPPEVPDEWRNGLAMFQHQLHKQRGAEELIGWWLQFKTTFDPAGVTDAKGLFNAAWSMFTSYAASRNHHVPTLAREIDKRMRLAKNGGK